MEKTLKTKDVRRRKGIAKQIGILKRNLEKINYIMKSQFTAGIIVGTLISVLLNLLFKNLGI